MNDCQNNLSSNAPPVCNVSIIISCFQRTKLIWEIIESIAQSNNDYENFEIILVDSNSCLENNDLPNRGKEKYPELQISIHHTENILSAKRNKGRLSAKYDWLIFIDDDCVPAKNWLQIYRNQFVKDRGSSIFCGEVHYEFHGVQDTRFLTWRKRVEDKAYKRGEELDFRSIVVMNMGIHRAVYDKIGGFSELFVGYGMEDQEFGWRAGLFKVNIRKIPAVIYHRDSVVSFIDFCRKMFFNGRDGAKNLHNHFPEIHAAIPSYKLIDPEYRFSSKLISLFASSLRGIIFPRPFCVFLFQVYKKFESLQKIWPSTLFRYLALFFFIEGARARGKTVSRGLDWYSGSNI